MKRETVKALLDSGVLQAYANGESIEVYTGFDWVLCTLELDFDTEPHNYRVKPKYREVTDKDIGKEIEVSVKNDYVKRKFVVKHNGKFYCEVDGEPEHLYGWRFARVPNE